MKNPYTLSFGREPKQMISRIVQTNEVLDNFRSDDPSQQVYMITGVRGIGKTVFMTEIAETLRQDKRWIVVELNPERDLLTQLAANLSSETALAQIFKSAKINLSFFGMGLEVSGEAPITDIEVALEKMLASLKKRGRRVLVAIDEITNTETVRAFVAAFQIFMRQDLPVFLLMTGLYENIYDLQNEKSLTFLYRAPKIELGPLNIGAIADNYAAVFHKESAQAQKMAALTNGYSFAFQALGYLTWEADGDYQSVLGRYKQYLAEYVYEKIWASLSEKDRQVVSAIAASDDGKIKTIREKLGMTNNQFNPYRARLIRKGIIDGKRRGYVRLTLPMFQSFIEDEMLMEA